MAPKNYLRAEDRILWETVAKTALPISGKHHLKSAMDDFDLWEQEVAPKSKPSAAPQFKKLAVSKEDAKPVVVKPKQPEIYPLDKPTHRKIAKGRLNIDARIDLHGLTQREAYNLLYGFLADAHARGLRHVLIITGKGRSYGSEGVLKQVVPHWFSTPIFRLLVSAYEDAAHHHGGHGALYVRLRRAVSTGLSL
ncbi:Smr/MutS family protein [Paenochrobactrum sp. BZR 588]|uniref:Smr/MutS family protein n=1 Tax=unclassified Paenochrobactrum TaxID=2639760 RepID=UPI0038540EB4